MVKKSSEAVIEAADAPTDDKALSNASVTETDHLHGTFSDPLSKLQARADEQAAIEPKALVERIAALEADIAFLRKQFGWPTKDA